MKLAVQWGRQTPVTVATAEELDAALDAAEATGRAQVVDLFDPDRDNPWGRPALVQVGVGHPDRSFVLFDAESAWAVEPGVEATAEAIWFDYGGVPTQYAPARTRVTPAVARRAAHEFLAAVRGRPTGVRWVTL